ncbi:serine/threonine-protein kinase [Streptomyces rectiviolaceus]|uniref:Protein kinase domain-containing protein n=1 Tax=Streptomyces rectiviolaceus TaxID=332591 RepID=A0ABP6M9G4_9ACTN
MDDRTADEPTAEGPCDPPPPFEGAPAAVGAVLDGRWSVAEIRRGGQAWVLIADDVERGVRRAIKTPLSRALAGDAELAVLLGLAPHPHVVTTFEEIAIGDSPGIVLEYVPSTLAEFLRERRGTTDHDTLTTHTHTHTHTHTPPPVPDDLADVLQQVCEGMAHLSRTTEMAHLDLKPSNVLLDGAGHAKVADFGLAQQVRIRDGRFPSARGGTWAYAAPEVLRQEPCDIRADIFSFGVLLYEACTGRLPYPFRPAPTPAEQRAQLLEYYETSGPRSRTQELYYGSLTPTEYPLAPPSSDIGMVISSCLMQHMDERPASFASLATMLSRGLRRPPVQGTDTSATSLPEIDWQHRELTLSQVLIRLGRFDEAVNRLNRLLAATSLPGDLVAAACRAAQEALTATGRHAEAAAMGEGCLGEGC